MLRGPQKALRREPLPKMGAHGRRARSLLRPSCRRRCQHRFHAVQLRCRFLRREQRAAACSGACSDRSLWVGILRLPAGLHTLFVGLEWVGLSIVCLSRPVRAFWVSLIGKL